MVLGALIGGAALGIGGSLIGSRGKKKALREQRRLGTEFIDRARTLTGQGNAQTESRINKSIDLISQGFGDARANVSTIGRQQKRDLAQERDRAAASATQRDLASGLSVQGDKIDRQVGRQFSDNLARVDEQLSRLFVDLDLGEAQGLAGGQQQLADFEQGKLQQNVELERALFDILSGTNTRGLNTAAFGNALTSAGSQLTGFANSGGFG